MKSKKYLMRLLATLMLAGPIASAWAVNDFASVNQLSQDEFATFAKDLSAGLAYRNLSSANADGIIGFDVSVDITSTTPDNKTLFKRANQGEDWLVMPRLNVRKGLPFDIDVGASASKVGGGTLLAIEARKVLFDNFFLLPVVSARLSHSQLMQSNALTFNSNQFELAASKSIINITPYAGIGWVNAQVGAKGGPLQQVRETQNKLFAGVQIGLGIAGLGIYVDRVGSTNTQGIRFSLGF